MAPSCPASFQKKHPGKVFLNPENIADRITEYQVFDTRYSLARKDYGIDEYNAAHLPGARFVGMDEHLSNYLPTSTARHPLPDAQTFIEWCKSNGIGAGKPVLCYDDECGALGACRMWWMLHALGVDAYVLNGGFQAYCAGGFPIETVPVNEKPQPLTNWPYETVFKRSTTVDEMPVNAVFVDSRINERYATTVRPCSLDSMPGHIPNAISFPWTSNILCNNGIKTLKPESECRSNVLKAFKCVWGDAQPDVSKFVLYCGSGITATFNVALMNHLGFGDSYLFTGSWSEYAGKFAFNIACHIVEKHGLFFKMISPNLCDNPKADSTNAVIIVDGDAKKRIDDNVQAAVVAHMHVGEKAQVFWKNGVTHIIEVHPL